jgi:hypothetical protein
MLDPEDAKLVTLARSAWVRRGAESAQGAAVRDTTGRTYVATSVDLPSLSLSALQVAVAMAISSGVAGLEAAVVLGEDQSDDAGVAALRDVALDAVLHFATPDGEVVLTT